jgi:hypothetical protein
MACSSVWTDNTDKVKSIYMGVQTMTKDWKSEREAKILLIGHDPRLQESDSLAEYCLFADYYFKPKPLDSAERRKYKVAETAFKHIAYVTKDNIRPKEVYITNLCNEALDHPPKGKTAFIPLEKAAAGIIHIRRILTENSSIQFVFPMSLQVNYWLQELGFYGSDNDFLRHSEPKQRGIDNKPSYYEPFKNRAFTIICGKQYKVNEGQQIVIPILHSKNFPLRGRLIATYGKSYERVRQYFAGNTF